MFSQIVTAAKGLFSRQDSNEASLENLHSNSGSTTSTGANTPKMVTATRQRKFAAEKPSTEPNGNGSAETNGKRKSEPVAAEPTETTQTNKRRKRSSLEAAQEPESKPSSKKSKTTEKSESKPEQPAAPMPKKHFRFDSEEPELPEVVAEETTETRQGVEDSDDDSSDDEAPETVDNSAQRSKIRMEAKKQERAKQM